MTEKTAKIFVLLIVTSVISALTALLCAVFNAITMVYLTLTIAIILTMLFCFLSAIDGIF